MNKLITKSMLMLAAVFVTVFASSCTDQLSTIAPIVDNAIETSSSMYDTESIASSIIDNNDDGFSMKGDRGRGPGRGRGNDGDHRGDSINPHRGDSISPKRAHLKAVIDCLQLSADQLAQLQLLINAKRDCEKAAKEQFKSVVGPIRQAEIALRKSLQVQLAAGTITRDEANAQLEAMKAKNATLLQSSIEAMKAAVKGCNDTLEAAIVAMLTPEQLLLWNQWKATGTNPCDSPVING